MGQACSSKQRFVELNRLEKDAVRFSAFVP
jgi:hypothetical protein